MDESRKRVLLIAASILAARKLSRPDSVRRSPASMTAIGDAVHWAEEIMAEIRPALAARLKTIIPATVPQGGPTQHYLTWRGTE